MFGRAAEWLGFRNMMGGHFFAGGYAQDTVAWFNAHVTVGRTSHDGSLAGRGVKMRVEIPVADRVVRVHAILARGGVFGFLERCALNVLSAQWMPLCMRKFVKGTYQGQDIYFNVESARKRAGIPREAILDNSRTQDVIATIVSRLGIHVLTELPDDDAVYHAQDFGPHAQPEAGIPENAMVPPPAAGGLPQVQARVRAQTPEALSDEVFLAAGCELRDGRIVSKNGKYDLLQVDYQRIVEEVQADHGILTLSQQISVVHDRIWEHQINRVAAYYEGHPDFQDYKMEPTQWQKVVREAWQHTEQTDDFEAFDQAIKDYVTSEWKMRSFIYRLMTMRQEKAERIWGEDWQETLPLENICRALLPVLLRQDEQDQATAPLGEQASLNAGYLLNRESLQMVCAINARLWLLDLNQNTATNLDDFEVAKLKSTSVVERTISRKVPGVVPPPLHCLIYSDIALTKKAYLSQPAGLVAVETLIEGRSIEFPSHPLTDPVVVETELYHKLWSAHGLLGQLSDLHKAGIFHGAISTETCRSCRGDLRLTNWAVAKDGEGLSPEAVASARAEDIKAMGDVIHQLLDQDLQTLKQQLDAGQASSRVQAEFIENMRGYIESLEVCIAALREGLGQEQVKALGLASEWCTMIAVCMH